VIGAMRKLALIAASRASGPTAHASVSAVSVSPDGGSSEHCAQAEQQIRPMPDRPILQTVHVLNPLSPAPPEMTGH
jgi:hypothetical protein